MYLDENPEIPYETLRYIIAVINYGGRVTDKIDERLIVGLLEKYMHADIMGKKYDYSSDGKYFSPKDLRLPNVRLCIDNLPREDDPEIFGMHPNAMITLQINVVKDFMNTLMLV